jgi:NitT/TauT family transport system ATP-binding protein
MSDSPPFVELKSVTKRFGDRAPVLTALDLHAHRGEFISIIGPSGCGKSTLLRLLSGLTPPTGGEILVENQTAESTDTERAFIFQDATLLPWLTVRQNTEALLRLRHTPADRRHALSSRFLELTRIAGLADQYPRQLSGGEKMRVSIARALTLEPQLLLLDEPFAALDELTREHLNEELLSLRERSRWTAFFVTHSVAEAVFLSTRILVLSAGHLVHDVPVDLPWPRHAATRATPAFSQLVSTVSGLLRTAAAT